MTHMLDKLKIRTRLTLAFGLLLVIMLVMAGAGLWSAQRFYGASETLYEKRARPLAQLGEIQLLVQRNRMLLLDMLNDPGSVQRNDKELVANVSTIETQLRAYLGSGLSGSEAELARVFESRYQAYLRDALLPAAAAMREGRYDDTAELFSNRVTPAAPLVQQTVEQLVKLQVQEAEAQFRATGGLHQRLLAFLGAAVGLALLVGTLTAQRITRSITAPLTQAADVARRVAEGDLRTHIDATGKDETASLLRALSAMNTRLIEVVDRVRHASLGVATGATEIAHGTADLSQRTEAQAANLEQTSASMDELGDTVRRNAAVAEEASRLVSQAEMSAHAGGEGVAQVETTMAEIARSSERMGDIIGTIDAIAFQTNILALNAAVEAARAGEQGRGFAVVAAEVRTLAQRSGAAAREIRDLISSSLVHVQTGTERVGTASQSVRGVVDQVRQVSLLIQQIASASDAQSRGMSEVTSAVDQLDQTTQHNAALVEQTSAACESLRQQARELTVAVDAFRLPITT